MSRLYLRALTATAALMMCSPAAAQEPEPVATQLKLSVKPQEILAGDRLPVQVSAKPFVAGQTVQVRLYRGKRRVAMRQVSLAASPDGSQGHARLRFTVGRAGALSVRATASSTDGASRATAGPERVAVRPLAVAAGGRGLAARRLRAMLAAKRYVVGARGVYDARTQRAVMAFRKTVGLPRNYTADASVFRRLAAGRGGWQVRFPGHGRHVEADISRQTMALIGAGGQVERIYHISSGAAATPTILGSFRVYRLDPSINSLGMVHSAYFIRGFAIHGYKSVPPYPASHGCLRVPVPDAWSIYRWMRIGTRVDTYR